MDLQAEARARLRDPWTYVALSVVLVIPLVLLVEALASEPAISASGEGAYRALLYMGTTSAAVFPVLALFLAAAAPEMSSRRDLLARFAGDVGVVVFAMVLGWGLALLLAVSLLGFDAALVPAFFLLLVVGTLYFGAWRGLASAMDAPGLETGRLLRRLFVLYLVVSVLLARVLQGFESRAMMETSFWRSEPPSHGLVAAQTLSPGSAYDHLVSTAFPEGMGMMRDDWFLVPWYSPWPFAAALLLWCAVPLALAAWRYPASAPPEPPAGPASADAAQ